MIDVADLRIFVCTTPTNMTYSFDSLMGRVQEIFDQDPTSGHLFLFFNRRRDRVKILFWDHDGFAIFYKRLEAGTFQMLSTTNDPEGIEIEVDKQNRITVTGARRQQVGQVAAEIRRLRPPEPYKGKGVRYSDEQVLRKEAKKK